MATLLLLSVRTTVPFRVPAAVGVKVTLTWQPAPGARLGPQLLVWAKSPVIAIELIVRGPVPILLTENEVAGLVVPIG